MSEKPKQSVFVIQGDMLAQWVQESIESASKDDIIRTQQGMIKSERMEKQRLKNLVEEKNLQIQVSWEQRKERLERVQKMLLNLVINKPGQTHPQYLKLFTQVYGFTPTVDNKLRALRKAGLVFSQPGPDKLLVWHPTSKVVEQA